MKKMTAVLLLAALCLSIPCVSFAADDPYSVVRGTVSSDTVIADTDQIYAGIISFEYEEENNCYSAAVYVENRTDEAIDFGAERIAVGGCIADGYMYNVLAPGRKSITYLEILADTVRQLRMDYPEEVSFRFYANITGDDGYQKILDRDFAFYPGGTSREHIGRISFDDFYTQFDLDNEFVHIREIDAKPVYNEMSYQIDFLVENRSGRDFVMTVGNGSVNGTPKDFYMYCFVPDGMIGIAHAWINADELEPYTVYDVDDFSATFLFYEDSEAYRIGEDTLPFFAYPVQFRPAKG